LSAIITSSTGAYVYANKDEHKVNLVQSKDSIVHKRSDKLNKKLTASWEESAKKFDVDMEQYTQYDYFDQGILLDKFPLDDRAEYRDVMLHTLNSVREPGDLVPILFCKRRFK
jgi:hypothetical protein